MLSRLLLRRILIGLVVVLCLGVGELWLYAAQKLGDHMHDRIFAGASFDDFCESSEISGFPFRLRVTCKSFSAPLRVGAFDSVLKAEEARGGASLFSPNHIVLTLTSPIALQRRDGASLGKFRHDGLTVDLAWSLNGVKKVEVSGASLDWRPETPEAGPAFNLEALTMRLAPSETTSGALHFDLAGQGFVAPLLQSLFKNTDPSRFAFAGEINPAPRHVAHLRTLAEEWRTHNGTVQIDAADWTAGALSVHFDGALSLDEARRPTGLLNVKASGASPLLARLGMPISVSQAKDLLGALLGRPKAAKPQDDTLALPLRLAQGQAFLGPLRLPAVLPSLY